MLKLDIGILGMENADARDGYTERVLKEADDDPRVKRRLCRGLQIPTDEDEQKALNERNLRYTKIGLLATGVVILFAVAQLLVSLANCHDVAPQSPPFERQPNGPVGPEAPEN